MEAAAVIMDAVARMAARQPVDDGNDGAEEQQQSHFDRALVQSLRANESPTFMLREAIATISVPVQC